MQAEPSIKQILDFYHEAGVDETIGEVPVDRFSVPAPVSTVRPATAPARKSVTDLKAVAPQSQPAALPNTELVIKAEECAAACTDLDTLKTALQTFSGCSLQKMATHTVFSRGDAASKIMLIDRPASAEEDRTGLPFAGASGVFLAKMLKAIGLGEETVYMTTVLPWRPPGGRAPTKEEQAICLPFIRRHIELAAPHTVLLFGEAASFMSGQKAGINRLRGKWMDLPVNQKSFKALPLFHPAFLIEHPTSKKAAWQDLLMLKNTLSRRS
ncbi:MAG: uracil-DNA glycosylase [Sneathiella sp.]